MRHAPQSLLLLGLALLAACSDPKDMAGWAERAESRADHLRLLIGTARRLTGDDGTEDVAANPTCARPTP